MADEPAGVTRLGDVVKPVQAKWRWHEFVSPFRLAAGLLRPAASDPGPGARRIGAEVVIGGAGFTLVDRLAVCYLAVPVALFFVQWFRPQFGVPLGLAALACLPSLIRGGATLRPPLSTTLFAVFAAFVWCALGGAGHMFWANAFDWVTRDAVLRDLVVSRPPIAYADHAGVLTILRAPLAYYMAPAMIGRLVGLVHADQALFVWTWLGVSLFFLQMMVGERRLKILLLIFAVVVLFAGLDIIELRGDPFDLRVDYSWWPHFYQYTPMTSLLVWVPNHAIPGWLSIALIYRGRDDPRFVGLAALLGALDLMWAPLVAIGLLPFFGLVAWRRWRRGEFGWLLTPSNVIAAPLIVVASGLYLTAAAGSITRAIVTPHSFWTATATYLSFVTLEFLILAAVLTWRRPTGIDRPFFALAILVLLVLPLVQFGPHNDLVMRASIPALSILLFSLIDGWARPPAVDHRWGLVPILIVTSAFSPVMEISRVLTWGRWAPNIVRSLYDVAQGDSPNYLLSLSKRSPLAQLLRPPVIARICAPNPSGPPANGAILSRAEHGDRRIVFVNPLDEDVVVKLRTMRRHTVLAAYLRGRSQATVVGVPAGLFWVDYARGRQYSSACGMFLKDLDALQLRVLLRSADMARVRLASPPVRFQSTSVRRVDVPSFIFQ